MPGRDVSVVGGSAGATEALTELLAGMPHDFRGTMLIAIHRGPGMPGVLPHALARAGSLPAEYASDEETCAGTR